MAQKTDRIVVAANTSSGDQPIVIPGFGTPTGAIIEIGGGSVSGTAVNHARISMGLTDGTNTECMGIGSEHGQPNSDTFRTFSHSDGNIVQLVDPSTAGHDAIATFVSFDANGITINWATPPAAGLLMNVILLSGINVQVGLATPVVGDLSIVCPFTPTALIATHIAAVGVPPADWGVMSYGYTDFVNYACITARMENNKTAAKSHMAVFNNGFASEISSSAQQYHFTVGSDGGGFKITGVNDGGTVNVNSRIAYMALDSVDVAVGIMTTENSAGVGPVSGLAFDPDFVHILPNQVTSLGSVINSGDPSGAFAVASFDAGSIGSISYGDEDASGTSDTQSMTRTDRIDVPDDDGTTGIQADTPVFGTGLFSLNFTQVSGNAKWPYIVFGPGGVVDVTAPIITNVRTIAMQDSFLVEVTTDEPASIDIEHGLTTGYGSTESESALATVTYLWVRSLAESTLFHYRILATDGSSNLQTGIDRTISTRTILTADRVQPYTANNRYWQHKGNPLLAVGGSSHDNLWASENEATITAEIAALVALGGNYLRSAVDGREVLVFFPKGSGSSFDLTNFNAQTVWRLAWFLDLCETNNIVVQGCIWDAWGHYTSNWELNPYSPQNNSNYTTGTSGLADTSSVTPSNTPQNAFFRTVVDSNALVLAHQERRVDWIIDVVKSFGNMLLTVSNEDKQVESTHNNGASWTNHWIDYVNAKGTDLLISEMWGEHDPDGPHHNDKSNPNAGSRYDFLEYSQNSQEDTDEQTNYDRFRDGILDQTGIRPSNMVKIYGSDEAGSFSESEAWGIGSMTRAIFAGLAAARFHRPPWGLGDRPAGNNRIDRLATLATQFDFWDASPDNTVLSGRAADEAYCVIGADAVAVWITAGGSVNLDLTGTLSGREVEERWLNMSTGAWESITTITAPSSKTVSNGAGEWVYVAKSTGATIGSGALSTTASLSSAAVNTDPSNALGSGGINVVSSFSSASVNTDPSASLAQGGLSVLSGFSSLALNLDPSVIVGSGGLSVALSFTSLSVNTDPTQISGSGGLVIALSISGQGVNTAPGVIVGIGGLATIAGFSSQGLVVNPVGQVAQGGLSVELSFLGFGSNVDPSDISGLASLSIDLNFSGIGTLVEIMNEGGLKSDGKVMGLGEAILASQCATTIRARVEVLAEAYPPNICSEWLRDCFADLVKHFPIAVKVQFASTTEDRGGGVPIKGEILGVAFQGAPALSVEYATFERASDPKSLYRASSLAPVWSMNAGRVHTVPVGGKITFVDIPEFDIEAAVFPQNVPEYVENSIVLYAAIRTLKYYLGQLSTPLLPVAPSPPTSPVVTVYAPVFPDWSKVMNLDDLTIVSQGTITLPIRPADLYSTIVSGIADLATPSPLDFSGLSLPSLPVLRTNGEWGYVNSLDAPAGPYAGAGASTGIDHEWGAVPIKWTKPQSSLAKLMTTPPVMSTLVNLFSTAKVFVAATQITVFPTDPNPTAPSDYDSQSAAPLDFGDAQSELLAQVFTDWPVESDPGAGSFDYFPSLPAFPSVTQPAGLVTAFTDMETALDDDDSEMAGARFSKIQAYLSEWQSDREKAMQEYQEEILRYNKRMEIYFNKIQTQAQYDLTHNNGIIGYVSNTLNSNPSAEAAKVNTRVNRYTQIINGYISKVQAEALKWKTQHMDYSNLVSSEWASWANRYQTEIQQNLQKFNADFTAWKSDFDIDLQRSQFQHLIDKNVEDKYSQKSIESERMRQQGFSSADQMEHAQVKLGYEKYQIEVNRIIQAWTLENIQSELVQWQARQGQLLQDAGLRMQDNQRNITEVLTKWQHDTSLVFQEYQAEGQMVLAEEALQVSQNQQLDMRSWTEHIGVYQLDMQEEQAKIQRSIQEGQLAVSLYGSDIQAYSVQSQEVVTRFGAEIQKFQLEVQIVTQRIELLVQEYQQSVQLLIGGAKK